MRWLVISPYLPHPDIGHGGGTAVGQLCEELARHHQTTLLCLQREDESGLDDWLRSRGVDVRTIPWRSDQAGGLARLALMADRARVLIAQQQHDRPYMVEKYDRPELRQAIDNTLDSEQFDAVQVEYSFLSPAARFLFSGRRPPSRSSPRAGPTTPTSKKSKKPSLWPTALQSICSRRKRRTSSRCHPQPRIG